jgi:hypothetical protein
VNLDEIEARWPEGRLANSDARDDVVALIARVRELEAERRRLETYFTSMTRVFRLGAEAMREMVLYECRWPSATAKELGRIIRALPTPEWGR